MGRTWILHTETKGTGAQMVPLESVTQRRSVGAPVFARRKPQPSQPAAPTPRPPHRFKIVDVLTRETLADRVDTRAAVEALRDIRSPVNVNVYVWREEPGRWRLLTFEEKRALWDLRDG